MIQSVYLSKKSHWNMWRSLDKLCSAKTTLTLVSRHLKYSPQWNLPLCYRRHFSKLKTVCDICNSYAELKGCLFCFKLRLKWGLWWWCAVLLKNAILPCLSKRIHRKQRKCSAEAGLWSCITPLYCMADESVSSESFGTLPWTCAPWLQWQKK